MHTGKKLALLKKMGEEREWMSARDACDLLEMSVDELYEGFNTVLPVFQNDFKTQIFPANQLSANYFVDQNVELFGHIFYDSTKERIFIRSMRLPKFLIFSLNELTGEWNIYFDVGCIYQDVIREIEEDNASNLGYGVIISRCYNYNEFFREVKDIRIDVSVKISNQFFSSVLVLDEREKFKPKFKHEYTILITANCGSCEHFAVPKNCFTQANDLLLPKCEHSDINENEYLAYVSMYAYYHIYLVPNFILKDGKESYDYFDIRRYAHQNILSIDEARLQIKDSLRSLNIKITDIHSFIKTSLNIAKEVIQWEEALTNVKTNEDKLYCHLAIGKLMGKSLTELNDIYGEIIGKPYSAESFESKISRLVGKAREFGQQMNLPVWQEKRGRKKAAPTNEKDNAKK